MHQASLHPNLRLLVFYALQPVELKVEEIRQQRKNIDAKSTSESASQLCFFFSHFLIVTVSLFLSKISIGYRKRMSTVASALARNSSTVSFSFSELCCSNQNMDSSMDRNAAAEAIFISQVTSQTVLGEREREEV